MQNWPNGLANEKLWFRLVRCDEQELRDQIIELASTPGERIVAYETAI